MKLSLVGQLTSARRHLQLLAQRRVLTHPLDRVREAARRVDELAATMNQTMRRRIQRQRDALVATAARLESLSPLQVLTRGYSVTQLADGRVLRSAEEARIGDSIVTRLQQGEVVSRIEQIQRETK
jgi:exodeoxyribonuclease VII large subunit